MRCERSSSIKDGIVYDARRLLADVARMVDKQKKERGIKELSQVALLTGGGSNQGRLFPAARVRVGIRVGGRMRAVCTGTLRIR